jgi:DNA-binding response OmpR family regulator
MPVALTILLVENSRSMRKLARQILHNNGYEVLEAENGQLALDIAMKSPPDLVLCDIHMPVLDGYTFVEKARQVKELFTLPILMLTARTDKASLRQAMSMGADDYLTKPFTPDELMKAVRSLEQKRSRHQADTEKSLNQLRSAILATVPHELRTPLTTILGSSQLLAHRRKRYSDERVDDLLTGIHEAASRLSRTITRMMDWSELVAMGENPSDQVNPDMTTDLFALDQRLNDDEFMSAVLASLSPKEAEIFKKRLADNPVQIRLGQGTVLFETEDLRRIILELVSNAVKFSAKNMPVGVVGKPIGIGLYAIEVANMGPAMRPEFVKQIGALSQADRETNEQQGTGLGLAMATLWAQRNSAHIQWPRTDGKPTIVRLTLRTD